MNLCTGLSVFPLTPLVDDALDERAFARLVERASAAGVQSITALGSTGSYAYLNVAERARAAELAVEHAGDVPVLVGVGALRTSHVLENVRSAERAGAAGVLLAPVSYQPLRPDEVFELFRTVTDATELPVIIYDNPTTTHFTFDLALYERIAHLCGVASIKIPPALAESIGAVRQVIPPEVTIGISGDQVAEQALRAGADAWYSVIAGVLPQEALELTRRAQAAAGGESRGATESVSGDSVSAGDDPAQQLKRFWPLFSSYGSQRVAATIAQELGLVDGWCLPAPLLPLDAAGQAAVREALVKA